VSEKATSEERKTDEKGTELRETKKRSDGVVKGRMKGRYYYFVWPFVYHVSFV